MAVYLYGAWFHLPCYQRENNFPIQERSVPRATAWSGPAWPVPRLMAWIDRARRAPSITHADAVELGRRGGLKGGKARAAKLSPAQRAAIARRAARARWAAVKARQAESKG
jgi:hypothetical protein